MALKLIKMHMEKFTAWVKARGKLLDSFANAITFIGIVLGSVALISLIWFYIRPVATADIKVPVATGQSSYAPGDPISGLFFGEIYFDGEVRILREVFCSDDYKRIIHPPPTAEVEKNFYSTQSERRTLEGDDIPIGLLPDDIAIGSNCVIKFTNVYRQQTLFGIRKIEYNYYTQNFTIVSKDFRDLLGCEADVDDFCDFVEPQ